MSVTSPASRPKYSVDVISPKTSVDRTAEREANDKRQAKQRERLREQDAKNRRIIRERQKATSDCIVMQKAIEQIVRRDPVAAKEWIREALKTAPGFVQEA